MAGFADATGRFLPLVATVNAARILTVTARMLGTDAPGLSRLALAAPAGAGGLTLLPYLDGERSPNRPGATGVLRGLTSTNTTPENLARAAVEALLCSLADAIGNLADRIRVDAVTDYIQIGSWPAFNLADVAVTAGVLLLAYAYVREPQ